MSIHALLLEAFHRADGQFVTGESLARRTGISIPEVGAELQSLRELGYAFETHPHLGYRLESAPDRLTADDIRARLQTKIIGSEILVFEQTASTNDVAEYLSRSGVREGLVVFAESQTRGRGRHGRKWESPRGKGLWFSVVLRPSLPPTAISRITVAASVAVAQAIRKTLRVDARIKWPNDVLVGGRKLCGILTELRGESDEVRAAILGVGIDVNCDRSDYPPELEAIATSLKLETGRWIDRAELAATVLNALDECYGACIDRFDAVIDDWARLCSTLGKRITVDVAGTNVEGFAQALDSDGALILRHDNGTTERILGGMLVKEQ